MMGKLAGLNCLSQNGYRGGGTQGNFPKRGTQGLQRGNRRGIEVGLQRGIHGGMKLATEPSECTDHWVSSRLGDPVGEARP